MKTILLLTLVLTGQRNIFKYVEDPPRRPKPKPAAAVVVAPAVVPQENVVREPIRQEPPTFDFPFRYIGSFGPAENLIAVLMSDRDVLTVRAGDPLADGTLVREITVEWIAVARDQTTRRVALAQ